MKFRPYGPPSDEWLVLFTNPGSSAEQDSPAESEVDSSDESDVVAVPESRIPDEQRVAAEPKLAPAAKIEPEVAADQSNGHTAAAHGSPPNGDAPVTAAREERSPPDPSRSRPTPAPAPPAEDLEVADDLSAFNIT
jgi:hypothetical protein